MTPPPPKKPPRDRDILVPKNPPRAESPVPNEEWSGDTGTHSTGRDDDTPLGLETVDAAANMRLRARVKETNTNAKEASTGVTTLRIEMQGHVERLEGAIGEVKAETTKQFGQLSTKVDTLGGEVRTATGAVVGAVSALNKFQGIVVENQLEKSKITWDVHANQQKLEDKDKADAAKQKRSFWYKVGGVFIKIGAAAGVVGATAIATHFIEKC